MKAVVYARFSSERQREESIEGQIRECREYAKNNDITIIAEYIDRALSASKDTDKRLEFQRMIRDSAKRDFDIVLVWKLDRFARSRYDSAHYKHILKKNGVRVMSATEAISNSAEGIILESMLEGMAEYYSAELSEKIHRGQKENALKGKSNGGGVPLGYRIGHDHKLEVDPSEAPVVAEIFNRYASGEKVRDIIADFNRRGIRSKKGKSFNDNSFDHLLRNRTYIGEYRYQDIVIPGGVPAIVSEDVFRTVQIRKEKNKRGAARAKATEIFLLTTKLYCGHCGKMMIGDSGTSHTGVVYSYYKCTAAKHKRACSKKAVRKQWIEDLVIKKTMELVFDDELMDSLIDALYEYQDKEPTEIKLLKQQIKEVDRKLQNILKAIEAGIVTETTKKRLDDLEIEKQDLEDALSVAELKNPVISKEQIACFVYGFRKLDPDKVRNRQLIIDSFVNSVYLYDDRIGLVYNYNDLTDSISLNDLQANTAQEGSDTDERGAPQNKTGPLWSGFVLS